MLLASSALVHSLPSCQKGIPCQKSIPCQKGITCQKGTFIDVGIRVVSTKINVLCTYAYREGTCVRSPHVEITLTTLVKGYLTMYSQEGGTGQALYTIDSGKRRLPGSGRKEDE